MSVSSESQVWLIPHVFDFNPEIMEEDGSLLLCTGRVCSDKAVSSKAPVFAIDPSRQSAIPCPGILGLAHMHVCDPRGQARLDCHCCVTHACQSSLSLDTCRDCVVTSLPIYRWVVAQGGEAYHTCSDEFGLLQRRTALRSCIFQGLKASPLLCLASFGTSFQVPFLV